MAKTISILTAFLVLLVTSYVWAGGFRYNRGSTLRNSGYYEQDDRGFTYRMGSDYSPIENDDYTIVDLKAPVNLKADCSGLNFNAYIKNALNMGDIKDFLQESLTSVIYNWLLMIAYQEPTIAAILTNAQAIGNMRLTAQTGQCTAEKIIEQANLNYNKFLTEYERCMLEEKHKGVEYQDARKICQDKEPDWGPDKKQSLLDVVFKTVKLPPEKEQKVRDILPDIEFEAEGRVGRKPPRYTIREIYKQERDRYEDDLKNIVIEARNGETVSEDDVKTLASGRTVITPQVVYGLASLPDKQAAFAGAKLADALAAAELIDRAAETTEILRLAQQSNAEMSEKERAELEATLHNLKQQVDTALWAKRAEDELVVEPIMALLAEKTYQDTKSATSSMASQDSASTSGNVLTNIDFGE